MSYPPSKNRAKKQDPNADAVAREQLKVKESVAAANWRNDLNNQSYAKYTDDVVDGVKNQTVAQRGAKHSRA